MTQKRTIILFSLIAVLLVGAAGYAGFATTKAPPAVATPDTVPVTTCDVEQSVSAPGNVVNTSVIDMEMPADGRLAEVYVQPGESVKKGEPLVQLDNPAGFEAARSAAELDVLQAQKTLDDLYKNAALNEAKKKLDLYDAKKKLQSSQATLEWLKEVHKRYVEASDKEKKQLYDAGETDFLKAQAQIEVNKLALDEAQAALDRLKDGVDPIEEAQAQVDLAEAQAALETAKQVEKDGTIRAPFDGVVLSIEAATGQTVHAGSKLLSFTNPKALEVQASVTEEDYPLLSSGMEVGLYFDALPDATLTGKVERIVPQRIDGSSSPQYSIYISLSEVPAGLVDGMSADAAVTIAKREAVLCLPRATVRASSGSKTVVKVWNGSQTVERQIEVGLRGDTYIEILSGLKEGEEVVTR
ncbi:MAG: efflux RND transporter periplasmic adaptor subunit [Anaerolineales bacterium]